MSTSSNRRRLPIPAHVHAAMDIYAGVVSSRRPFTTVANNVVNLGSGDPAFITPAHIRAAAKASIDAGRTHYERNVDLKVAIARQMAQRNCISVDPKDGLLVTAGTHNALYLIFRAYIEPGDEVIMSNPGSYYKSNTLANGGTPVEIPLRRERHWRMDPAEIAAKITPRTKFVCITSPEAPAGSVLPRTDLEAIADLAIKHDLVVISDELYQEIHYLDALPPSIASLPGMDERTITVNGVSKAWAMTGWRLGWIAGPNDLMLPVQATGHLNQITTAASSQFAALAALTGPQGILDDFRQEYRRRRDRLTEGLRRIPGLEFDPPEGTYYFWVDIRSLSIASERFWRYCLEQFGLNFNPGTAFGTEGEGYIRLSCTPTDADVDEGLTRLEAAIGRRRNG